MTNDQITTLLVLSDVKSQIIHEMSSTRELLYLANGFNDADQIALQNGKLVAYKLVMEMINKHVRDIKDQVSNEQMRS